MASTEQPAPADWSAVVGLGVLLAAGGLWLRSMSSVEPRSMTELGLISVLPATFFVAVALLTGGFVVLSSRPARHRSLLAAYVTTFAAVAHATSAAVSGTLGNAWAWANVGVVDDVRRTGALPAAVGPRAAPTEWPGVQTFTALLSDVSGVAPATLARWMPLGFTLVALLALRVLFGAFTSDERVVWSAMWLFVLGTWVGQEYLSPQALSVPLGLALLAVALPLDRWSGGDPVLVRNRGPAGADVGPLGAAVAFIGLVGAAIVVSNAVTPVVLAATFAVAAAARASRTWWLAIALGVATVLWLVGPAWSYVGDDALAVLRPAGSPAQFATLTTGALSDLGSNAQTVLIAGRFVAQGLVALAVVGLLIRWRRRQRVGFLVGAALAPLVVLVAGGGSETLLLAFLHALAWLALAGAFGLALLSPGWRPGVDLALRLSVIGALTAGFVVAQSGERGAGYFTAAEVELATWLSTSAPAGTLMIEGSFDGPFGGQNVGRVERVSLADEAAASLADLAVDPEGVLHERMTAATADGFTAAFVVLTRSQRHGELIAPRLPAGLLDSIEVALRGSPRFTVVGENADGVVFALAGGGS